MLLDQRSTQWISILLHRFQLDKEDIVLPVCPTRGDIRLRSSKGESFMHLDGSNCSLKPNPLLSWENLTSWSERQRNLTMCSPFASGAQISLSFPTTSVRWIERMSRVVNESKSSKIKERFHPIGWWSMRSLAVGFGSWVIPIFGFTVCYSTGPRDPWLGPARLWLHYDSSLVFSTPWLSVLAHSRIPFRMYDMDFFNLSLGLSGGSHTCSSASRLLKCLFPRLWPVPPLIW